MYLEQNHNMKIIFLDIDGVLNIEEERDTIPMAISSSGIRYRDFDDIPIERCVNNLNRVISETGAEIVITSTWRIQHSVLSLMYIFFLCGVKPAYILGRTSYDSNVKRGEEITEWLKEHPEITNFVILDDDSDMVDLMDHLILIDPEVGLTEADANKAIEMLNKRN